MRKLAVLLAVLATVVAGCTTAGPTGRMAVGDISHEYCNPNNVFTYDCAE